MSKIENIAKYIDAIANNDLSLETYRKYEKDILSVTGDDLFTLFYERLNKQERPQSILRYLDRLMHVFYQNLKNHVLDYPVNDFLDGLHQENEELAKRLEDIKVHMRRDDWFEQRTELVPRFKELLQFDVHYLKKENILFSYLEKQEARFQGVSIMWSLHDQTRQSLKDVIELLSQDDKAALTSAIGRYFFDAYGLIQKEEAILFVVSNAVLSAADFKAMQHQSFDFGFAFIDPKQPQTMTQSPLMISGLYESETGSLTFEQITILLNTLPMDCTVVDEHDKVIFFNNPKERHFYRSKAVIGRDVKNCHPAESVHIVNDIVDSFKQNKKDVASFWINFKGKKILIQYFALRDENNTYKGVVEISQDISEILTIKGEKRLLDWD